MPDTVMSLTMDNWLCAITQGQQLCSSSIFAMHTCLLYKGYPEAFCCHSFVISKPDEISDDWLMLDIFFCHEGFCFQTRQFSDKVVLYVWCTILQQNLCLGYALECRYK